MKITATRATTGQWDVEFDQADAMSHRDYARLARLLKVKFLEHVRTRRLRRSAALVPAKV